MVTTEQQSITVDDEQRNIAACAGVGYGGSSGALTVTPSITDTTTNKSLNYNNGESDINSLTSLGISVNNDGSLTLDATSLDSVLNSDYSSVVGFFQNANSWGQTFSNMLTDSGTQFGDRHSGAGLKFQQQHRIHSQCGYLQGEQPDLRAADRA